MNKLSGVLQSFRIYWLPLFSVAIAISLFVRLFFYSTAVTPASSLVVATRDDATLWVVRFEDLKAMMEANLLRQLRDRENRHPRNLLFFHEIPNPCPEGSQPRQPGFWVPQDGHVSQSPVLTLL